MLWEVEKADPVEGTIQLVVFKGRPAGSGEGDRDGEGLDPEAAAKALGEWCANFGSEIDYYNPSSKRMERRFCGVYDSHKEPIDADLLWSWYFAEEQKARIVVRPRDKRYVDQALNGEISGASWRGSVYVEEVEETD